MDNQQVVVDGSAPVVPAPEPRVTVGGDPEGGWLVDVHDGVHAGVYSPDAVDADEAKAKALDMHATVVANIQPSDGLGAFPPFPPFPPASLASMFDGVTAEWREFMKWARTKLEDHGDLITQAHDRLDAHEADIKDVQALATAPPPPPVEHQEGEGDQQG